MSRNVNYYFGKLTAVAFKSKNAGDAAQECRNELVGETGLVQVLDAPRNRQCVLFEVFGYGMICTDAEKVEIIDGKLAVCSRDVIYVFEIDDPDARTVCLNKEINRLMFLISCDLDRDRVFRLYKALEPLRRAVRHELMYV